MLMPPAERQQAFSGLGDSDFESLEYDWGYWGRPSQLAPEGEWSVWAIVAGRGFGKTLSGAQWVRGLMCGSTPLERGVCQHMALVGESADEVRKVMVGDGKREDDVESSGLLQVHPPDFRPKYEPSKKRLTWPNGAIASIYYATEPDLLRGPQHDAAWCDEFAKWRYVQETWDQLQFGLRAGDPRVCITTTPKPIKLLKEILADTTTVKSVGSTFDNAANLPQKFLQTVLRKYQGTRLGRQELFAEILEDVEGAMWNRTMLDALRRKPGEVPPLVRVVVGLDPAVTSGEDSDETGIVVVGLGVDGHGYVFDDFSGIYTPNEWSLKTIAAYRNPMRPADRVIGEVNNGGEMIEHTLRVVDASVSYKSVHASHGKVTRAEPVAALYEQKLVHHVGGFPQLEDQMCEFTTGFDKKEAGYSPDRMDALVWALTELMLVNAPGAIFDFFKQQAASVDHSPPPAFGYQVAGGAQPVPNTVPPTNAMANQPRIEPNTVRLEAPANVSQVYGGLGNVYVVGSDRIITVTKEDAKPLIGQGFKQIMPAAS